MAESEKVIVCESTSPEIQRLTGTDPKDTKPTRTVPNGICVIITIMMPTPRSELWDILTRYLSVKMNMSIGAIDCFHTNIPSDHISTLSTHVNDSMEGSYCYPLLLQCSFPGEDFVFKSGLKQKPLGFATAYDCDVDDIEDPSEVFVTNNMDLSADQQTVYCYKLKMLADYDVIDRLDDIIALEHSLEFQITYLKHSHLIMRLDPIENYPYKEGVISMLQGINEKIHPWIPRDSLRMLSEKQVRRVQKRKRLITKMTRPDVREEPVEETMTEEEMNRILNEYRAKKEKE